MNIKQAKQYIKDIVKLYLKKDEYGEYRIPVARQRPVFMLGAPGVGKTAIMEQIASELGIALVNYSMTHHTRQSALGLPFIVHKEYDGFEADVTEYTMSEIISSIYDVMESSSIREGILFLDEINCVSETLSPAMLQFLQFKTFGRYSVPEGWVIVTAGNPPEYNKSVREFDVVTYDRMKLMEIEADYSVWKEYARDMRLHGAVIGYLEINKDDFYQVDTTVRGRGYVTARGWEDLSQVLMLYEEEHIPVDEDLVAQYLRNDRIVREFSAYYDLYSRYVSDYRLDEIIRGEAGEYVYDRASGALMDERMSLTEILTGRLLGDIRTVMEESDIVRQIFNMLKGIKESDKSVSDMIHTMITARETLIDRHRSSGAYLRREREQDRAILAFLRKCQAVVPQEAKDRDEGFAPVRDLFEERKKSLERRISTVSDEMTHILDFVGKAFGEGNELVLILTELTSDSDAAAYLSRFGHEGYNTLARRLMINDPTQDLQQRADDLDL